MVSMNYYQQNPLQYTSRDSKPRPQITGNIIFTW